MKIKGIELHRDGMSWGDDYFFYWWNWLSKDMREFSYSRSWHDGPIGVLTLWFVNVTWKTQWMDHSRPVTPPRKP